MLRILSFSIVFGLVLSALLVFGSMTGLSKDLGRNLELIFGPVRWSGVRSYVPPSILIGLWISIALSQFVPSWRIKDKSHLPRWPLKVQSGWALILRGIIALMAVMLVSILIAKSIPNAHRFIDETFSIMVPIVVFFGFLLYDARIYIFSDPSQKGDRTSENESGNVDALIWPNPIQVVPGIVGTLDCRIAVAQDLRRRAERLYQFSSYTLRAIGALLVVAVLVILFSGFIAGLGVGETVIERARSIASTEKNKLDKLKRSGRQVENKINRSREEYSRENLGSVEEILLGKYDAKMALNDSRFRELLADEEESLAQIRYQEDIVKVVVAAEGVALQKTVTGQIKPRGQEEDANLLIASGVTRFGVLFVLIFMIQILVIMANASQRPSSLCASGLFLPADAKRRVRPLHA